MNHISLRSLIEDEIWYVIVDPNRNIIDDFPDIGHVVDPFMQNILNEYHEFKISDTVFKSINSCTMIEIINNDGLAENLRNSGLEPSTDDFNFPEIVIENVDWGCGDCRISFYKNILSNTTEGSTVQFVPHRLDSLEDTVLSGYELSWRFNDTLKSNSKYPTFFLPDNVDLDVNVISKSNGCYYQSYATYKKSPCTADFDIDEGNYSAGSYQIWLTDNSYNTNFYYINPACFW